MLYTWGKYSGYTGKFNTETSEINYVHRYMVHSELSVCKTGNTPDRYNTHMLLLSQKHKSSTVHPPAIRKQRDFVIVLKE